MGVVDVDVGGNLFRTTETTLKKLLFLFAALLECDGPLFVDRSLAVFEQVLELLRTDQVKLATKLESERVKEEIRFYGLDPDGVHMDVVKLEQEGSEFLVP